MMGFGCGWKAERRDDWLESLGEGVSWSQRPTMELAACGLVIFEVVEVTCND